MRRSCAKASAGVLPATEPMLEVDIEHRLGTFALDVHFRSGRGLTALFGRSGGGKTSVVNTIAGLISPHRGRIVVDGSVLTDTELGIRLPTHRRRVGYVFQEGRLFPHLTVRQNLLFGRWFAPMAAPPGRLDDVIDLLGIGALLGRRSSSAPIPSRSITSSRRPGGAAMGANQRPNSRFCLTVRWGNRRPSWNT